ncbi:META domain-containing protein [Novosphingobium sp.]|uniref:META domain-containing protein n=1 Tax=Novosphingobium sp. TaxID=1874826 RepID=UPI0027377726|nr:META domain-containing protein [Novosphingobium sp.]MDP3906953.1 META domain-containing protein [Novosphingobium sp.]
MIRTITLTAIAALSLTACAHAAAPRQTALHDTNWKIVRIDGKAPASERAAIRFTQDRLSATVGCNGQGGTWRIEQGKLVGGPYMSTMMYCDGLMEQERALADLLGAKPSVDVTGGTLTLRSKDHVIEARRVR